MPGRNLFSTPNLILILLFVALHQTQESVKTLIEEVRIPVTAVDGSGRFDPTVGIEDLTVKEDGVVQQLRSLYRIPGSVLLLLDTGGEKNLAKTVPLTREVALALVSALHKDDQIAVMQVSNRVELVQEWTRNKSEVIESLEKGLFPGKRSALAVALTAAVEYFEKVPSRNPHLVLVSDGVVHRPDEPGLEEAFKSLIAANITVHIISYTSLGLKAKKSEPTRPRVKSAVDPNLIDPLPSTREPGDPTPDLKTLMKTSGGGVVDVDVLFRRGINKTLREREKEFLAIAEETGGTVGLPVSADEMIDQALEVARNVDSQYIVSYKPLRSLGSATANEYRRIDIFSRRVGLNVRARRGYVAKVQK